MPFINRQPRPSRVALLSVCALALACGAGERDPRLENADMPALEQQGTRLRATVERYQQQRGAYPATLAEAGLRDSAWATPFGPWRYARAGEGPGVAPE